MPFRCDASFYSDTSVVTQENVSGFVVKSVAGRLGVTVLSMVARLQTVTRSLGNDWPYIVPGIVVGMSCNRAVASISVSMLSLFSEI